MIDRSSIMAWNEQAETLQQYYAFPDGIRGSARSADSFESGNQLL